MIGRLRRELGVGLGVLAVALGAGYAEAERSGAFDESSGKGRALRLVCPLH